MNPEIEDQRQRLLHQLAAQGITDEGVLAAMGAVPRHELVPEGLIPLAYADRPLPIGEGQTISQPFIVALMSQLAELHDGERVLEVGTGSGYQTAVLAELAAEVYTIEIVSSLGERARERLEAIGLAEHIHFRIGDGYAGWPEAAPFDAIVVTAAPPRIPAPFEAQLRLGGRLVIPVGAAHQELRVLEKTEHGLRDRAVIPVRFVPMTGRAQRA